MSIYFSFWLLFVHAYILQLSTFVHAYILQLLASLCPCLYTSAFNLSLSMSIYFSFRPLFVHVYILQLFTSLCPCLYTSAFDLSLSMFIYFSFSPLFVHVYILQLSTSLCPCLYTSAFHLSLSMSIYLSFRPLFVHVYKLQLFTSLCPCLYTSAFHLSLSMSIYFSFWPLGWGLQGQEGNGGRQSNTAAAHLTVPPPKVWPCLLQLLTSVGKGEMEGSQRSMQVTYGCSSRTSTLHFPLVPCQLQLLISRGLEKGNRQK